MTKPISGILVRLATPQAFILPKPFGRVRFGPRRKCPQVLRAKASAKRRNYRFIESKRPARTKPCGPRASKDSDVAGAVVAAVVHILTVVVIVGVE